VEVVAIEDEVCVTSVAEVEAVFEREISVDEVEGAFDVGDVALDGDEAIADVEKLEIVEPKPTEVVEVDDKLELFGIRSSAPAATAIRMITRTITIPMDRAIAESLPKVRLYFKI
jgi:hypothetical protein